MEGDDDEVLPPLCTASGAVCSNRAKNFQGKIINRSLHGKSSKDQLTIVQWRLCEIDHLYLKILSLIVKKPNENEQQCDKIQFLSLLHLV